MIKNIPNLVKKIDIQVWEAQRVPEKKNSNRTTSRHIIIKMAKFIDKEKMLKAARKKHLVTCKGALLRLSTDFSTETLQARRE